MSTLHLKYVSTCFLVEQPIWDRCAYCCLPCGLQALMLSIAFKFLHRQWFYFIRPQYISPAAMVLILYFLYLPSERLNWRHPLIYIWWITKEHGFTWKCWSVSLDDWQVCRQSWDVAWDTSACIAFTLQMQLIPVLVFFYCHWVWFEWLDNISI